VHYVKKQHREMSSHEECRDRVLRKWRKALSSRGFREQYWEGPKAYSELERQELVERVRLEQFMSSRQLSAGELHCQAKYVMQVVCEELAFYKTNIHEVWDKIERYKDLEHWLSRHQELFRKKSEYVRRDFPELAKFLSKKAKAFDDEIREIQRKGREVWNQRLNIAGMPFGVAKIRPAPQQGRELDTRIQVRLGVIFKQYLGADESKLSLRTVARLIVLFLVCAELADPDGNGIRLRHSAKHVCVDSVLLKLRRAQLNRKLKYLWDQLAERSDGILH
jgi:hypothetical protein